MKNIRQKRSTAISGSRWLAYATASTATALTSTPAAEAAIHYSGPVDILISGYKNDHATLPLDQPGDALRFVHRNTLFGGVYTNFAGFQVDGIVAHGFRGPASIDYAHVNNLHRGRYVSKGHFTTFGNYYHFGTLERSAFGGGYFGRGVGYIGFFFNGGAGGQYGWARVKMLGPENGNGFKVLDYAYADPGESIRVGQTSSDAEAPVLGSLGLLAAGAAGLVACRRKRSSLSQ
jgi:hypothetical protein